MGAVVFTDGAVFGTRAFVDEVLGVRGTRPRSGGAAASGLFPRHWKRSETHSERER
jgi:hypothetical protein